VPFLTTAPKFDLTREIVPKNIRVMPRTYQEFMMYLDARRRAEQVRRTLEEGVSVSPKTAEASLTE
jgi:acyl-coenzyme A thioesterase 9